MFTDLIILALLTSGVMLCYTEAIVGHTIYLSLKPNKIFLLNCLFLSFRLFFLVGKLDLGPLIHAYFNLHVYS